MLTALQPTSPFAHLEALTDNSLNSICGRIDIMARKTTTTPAGTAQYHPLPNPPADPRSHGPVRVIYAGLMRMGSFSMAHAFARLGLRTHHQLEGPWAEWTILNRAAHATFPFPGERPKPFTRENWEEIFGGYDAVTDAAGFFVPQLVTAYPDAKVVLVQRDFDAWWRSFYSEVAAPNFPPSWIEWFLISGVFGNLLGVEAGFAMERMLKGWFRARDLDGIQRNARARYEEHYAWIRANVPSERLLEYRLGDGWEPLCKFLDVEAVPDEPFPRVNDVAQHRAYTGERMWWLLPILAKRIARGAAILCFLLGLLALYRGKSALGWILAGLAHWVLGEVLVRRSGWAWA